MIGQVLEKCTGVLFTQSVTERTSPERWNFFPEYSYCPEKKEFRSSAARLVQWSAHPALKEATSQLQHVVPSGALFGIADGDAR